MSPYREIAALLDEEFRHLTSGNYVALADLVARKEALVQELTNGSFDADPDSLASVAAAASRNAEIIKAARRGFATAGAEIRNIRRGLTLATYGRDGARRPLAGRTANVEQKL